MTALMFLLATSQGEAVETGLPPSGEEFGLLVVSLSFFLFFLLSIRPSFIHSFFLLLYLQFSSCILACSILECLVGWSIRLFLNGIVGPLSLSLSISLPLSLLSLSLSLSLLSLYPLSLSSLSHLSLSFLSILSLSSLSLSFYSSFFILSFFLLSAPSIQLMYSCMFDS